MLRSLLFEFSLVSYPPRLGKGGGVIYVLGADQRFYNSSYLEQHFLFGLLLGQLLLIFLTLHISSDAISSTLPTLSPPLLSVHIFPPIPFYLIPLSSATHTSLLSILEFLHLSINSAELQVAFPILLFIFVNNDGR